jgi:hypothetical protein
MSETPENILSEAIAQQERDRLKAVAKREKIDRRRQPYTAYYGTDSATGQVRVKPLGSAGVLGVRSVSNSQPSMGQFGRGFGVGFDAGIVRKPKIEVFSRTTYPFKTLLGTDLFQLFLGGDRLPLELAQASALPKKYQLLNMGINEWAASFLDETVTPNLIRFVSPSGSKTLIVRAGSLNTSTEDDLRPVGQNTWLQFADNPRITVVRIDLDGRFYPEWRRFQGNPISKLSEYSQLGVYTRQRGTIFSQTAWEDENGFPVFPGDLPATTDFTVRYNYTAAYPNTVPVSTQWPPYSTAPYPLGSDAWTKRWSTPTQTQSQVLSLAIAIAVFEYNANLSDPVQGYTGTIVEDRNYSDARVRQSATTFVSDSNETSIKQGAVEIPLVGTQKRSYSVAEAISKVHHREQIDRFIGPDYFIPGYDSNITKQETSESLTVNPLPNLLKGDRCCFVAEILTGSSEAYQQTVSRLIQRVGNANVTSGSDIEHLIVQPRDKIQYWLLTESRTYEIAPEQAYIFTTPLNGSLGIGTFPISGSVEDFNVDISRHILVQRESTRTENLNTSSIQRDTIYTSQASDIFGLPVEIYRLKDGIITQYLATLIAYDGVPRQDGSSPIPPATGPGFTNTFIGPYPQRAVRLNSITVDISEINPVPFTAFPLENNKYTFVINPNFALIKGNGDPSDPNFDSGVLGVEVGSLKFNGEGGAIATAYVSSRDRYKAGQSNYADAWDFVFQPNNTVRPIKRSAPVSGRTKPNGAANLQTLAVQYWA